MFPLKRFGVAGVTQDTFHGLQKLKDFGDALQGKPKRSPKKRKRHEIEDIPEIPQDIETTTTIKTTIPPPQTQSIEPPPSKKPKRLEKKEEKEESKEKDHPILHITDFPNQPLPEKMHNYQLRGPTWIAKG